MSKPISVGIDLGTTFSVAAYVNEAGQPEIITNQSQRDAVSLPSVVYYESENSIVVGEPALTEAEVSPNKVIRSAKRFIGEDYTPPSDVPQDETPVKFEAKVLKALKKYVEEHSNGYVIKNAVITVPAYFTTNKVNLTREAAERADIEVLGIINEPMAAAIYYCAGQEPKNQKILVYDLGGGTFDSVIIELCVSDGKTTIVTLADDGHHQLGGDNWDQCLMSYLLKQARLKNEEIPFDLSELNPEDRQNLWKKANDLKQVLSDNEERTVRTLKFGDITVRDITVTREAFEKETEHLLRQTVNLVDSVLSMAALSEADIDLVLLVGGSSFMPMVQKYARSKFGEDKVQLKEPNLAVAKGAAIYAQNMDYYLENNIHPTNPSDDDDWPAEPVSTSLPSVLPKPAPVFGDIEIKSIASHSLGVRFLNNGKYYVANIIFKGDEYPKEIARDDFSSPNDGGFAAHFYENDSTDREDIPMIENRIATGDDDSYMPLDNRYKMDYLGNLTFNNDGIRAGDQVKVTIIASQHGSKGIVEHIPTGISDTIHFSNKHTGTVEEIEEDKQKLSNSTFALD